MSGPNPSKMHAVLGPKQLANLNLQTAQLVQAVQDLQRELMKAQQVAQQWEQAYHAKQAELDRVMLEHCPDEMTPEQMAEWEAHQVSP